MWQGNHLQPTCPSTRPVHFHSSPSTKRKFSTCRQALRNPPAPPETWNEGIQVTKSLLFFKLQQIHLSTDLSKEWEDRVERGSWGRPTQPPHRDVHERVSVTLKRWPCLILVPDNLIFFFGGQKKNNWRAKRANIWCQTPQWSTQQTAANAPHFIYCQFGFRQNASKRRTAWCHPYFWKRPGLLSGLVTCYRVSSLPFKKLTGFKGWKCPAKEMPT